MSETPRLSAEQALLRSGAHGHYADLWQHEASDRLTDAQKFADAKETYAADEALLQAGLLFRGAELFTENAQLRADLAAAQAERDTARQLVDDVLAERADEDDSGQCDDCSAFVLCRFHSVLSALARRTWTMPAIERDALQRRAEAADALAQRLREALRHVAIQPVLNSSGEFMGLHECVKCCANWKTGTAELHLPGCLVAKEPA